MKYTFLVLSLLVLSSCAAVGGAVQTGILAYDCRYLNKDSCKLAKRVANDHIEGIKERFK